MASALKSCGPLDGATLPEGERLGIRQAPRAARFILRGSPEVAARAGESFGAAPSPKPRRASVAGGRAALWLGPDEWLLIAEGEAPATLGAQLEAALAGAPHALVDVSQRQIGLLLEGPLAARALSAGCPLDLDELEFAVGEATRTMLSKAEAVLWRRGPQSFHLEVWRSFADYAVSFLSEAAKRAPGK
jgi:sarcosine oxidase, subunit gamma